MRFLVPVASLVLALAAGNAAASTADGVLITNLASATYKTTSGAGQVITYGATVNVLVATPVVMLRKQASGTLQASGGTVTFCISYSNSGKWASAFNVVITDAMPDNMRFVNGSGNEVGPPAGSSVVSAWSTNGGGGWTSGSTPFMAQGTPVLLRWTVDVLGPGDSGFVCYTVSVL